MTRSAYIVARVKRAYPVAIITTGMIEICINEEITVK